MFVEEKVADAKSGRPPSQKSPALYIISKMDKERIKEENEQDDLIDSFKTLNLKNDLPKIRETLKPSDTLKPDHCCYTFTSTLNEIDGSDSELDLEESDDENNSSSTKNDASEDDIFVPKCPDKPCKKTKEHRLNKVPYKDSYFNRYHHSGGSIIDNSNTFNACISEVPLDNEDLALIEEFYKDLTPEQKENLSYALAKCTNEKNVDITQCESSSCHGDEDSAYDTGSPGSSLGALSPIPMNEHTYGSSPNMIIPTVKTNTYTLNIPEVKPTSSYSNIFPRGSNIQPNLAPVRQHVVIAPENIAVYETEMKDPASERIKRRLNKSKLGIEWIRILLDAEFSHHKNEKYETKLMVHLRNRNCPHYEEILHVMLIIIKQKSLLNLLEYVNPSADSALTIAVNELKDNAIIARYILEVLHFLGHDPEEADSEGNTWIHRLASYGDEYVQVMAEFLNMEQSGFKFDVNKKNFFSDTPLHICTKNHSQSFSTLAVTKLLVIHNADVSLQDCKGLTPIHVAINHTCSSQLIKTLLASNYTCRAAAVTDNEKNSALHYAAARTDLDSNHQLEIMSQLVSSQWTLKAKNKSNQVPLDFIQDSCRRRELQDYLSKK